MNFEVKYIKKLIEVLSENNLSEISIEDRDQETNNIQGITIKRATAQVKGVKPVYQPVQVKEIENKEKVEEKTETQTSSFGTPVLSPMTGTFYAASSPQAEPFVKAGEVVSQGQVLCIVEAMKLMNEIEAETSGRITKICVQDGEMVESGQTLMYIE